MLGALSVLAGVGIVCASSVAISSAFKFFHTYEYDLTAKIKESKKNNKLIEKEIGGENHDLHMAKISSRIRDKQ